MQSTRKRAGSYVLFAAALLMGCAVIRDSAWRGSHDLHTVTEVIATGLASMIGALALLRFRAKRDNTFLFLGVGFLGTAFMDGYHTVVTSRWFATLFPTPLESLSPWSWNASRTFLALLMLLSWWAWGREQKAGRTALINERAVYASVSALTLVVFVSFALIPLPRAYYPELALGRPEELIAAFFFLLALVGYLTKGAWKSDPFEYWIVLSLIVGFATQTLFMPFSTGLFDAMFDAAHLLKIFAYLCVLTGLLVAIYHLFREEADHAARLEREVEERTTAQRRLAAQESVARILAGTPDSDKAIAAVLESIGTSICWQASAFWLVDDDAEVLRCHDFWHHPSADVGEFESASRSATFARGVGLPGRVWTSEGPAWIEDVTADANYPRAAHARTCGIHGAFAFPIRVDGEPFAVMEFYSRKIEQPDATLLALMEAAGRQIGQYISRTRVEVREKRVLRELEAQKKALDKFAIVAETDAHGRLTYVNDQFCEISKYSREELIGKDHRDVVNSGHHPPELWKEVWGTIGRGELWRGDICNRAKDGSIYWVDTTIVPFMARNGKPEKYLAIRAVITARKVAEEELRRSNHELEQFAYVASHDLQEPLRMVASYTQLLSRRYKGKLDADADEFINFAVDGANRMGDLIQALLSYSRIGSAPPSLSRLDANAIARNALDNLRAAIEENRADVEIDALPEVLGDNIQLLQLFQNLVANALKFSREGVRPSVRIGAQEHGASVVFSVKDNGIGINAEHTERIFEIFKRLHSGSAYPGTGIGLAVCKKIVERHSGRIWLESTPGAGTTFYVQLPRA